jgi:protein-S-isoprenylcysteine O-methyltransferase Ste14
MLLQFHDGSMGRAIGFLILYLSMALYFWSLRHLGDNYSPCYDSYLPTGLVMSGPYKYIRHPMYLAKIFVGVGTVIVSGSLWFVLPTLYLVIDTSLSMFREERCLTGISGFDTYRQRTKLFLPFIL